MRNFIYSRIYELRFWFKMKKKKHQDFPTTAIDTFAVELSFHFQKNTFVQDFCEKLLAIIYNSVFMLYYEWWWKIINVMHTMKCITIAAFAHKLTEKRKWK